MHDGVETRTSERAPDGALGEAQPRGTVEGQRRLDRSVDYCLAGIGVAGLVLAAALASQIGELVVDATVLLVIEALALALGLFSLLHLRAVLRGHLVLLERMRGAVITLTASDNAVLPLLPDEADREAARLHQALGELTARTARDRATPDRRLAAVLSSITDAILVITDQGQVSLVNYPAKALLGAEEIRVGTSVFAALKRDPVVAAMTLSEEKGRIVAAELETVKGVTVTAWISAFGEHGGAVISIPSDLAEQEAGHRGEIEHDLDLHDQPPAGVSIEDTTPLENLPVLVMDCETTGLNVRSDRVVSIGAVRLHGTRVYRSRSFDRLVNPGQPIPPPSTAVHGITDAMVVDAEAFPAVFDELRPLLEGTVIVGHNIPFDLAVLRHECERAGLAWQTPVFLDTLPMVAALDPALADLNLEGLAERFGVDIHGRHTALGDSLVTAEIYARLVPQLIERGVTDLAGAQAHSGQAKAILDRQKRAGW